MRDEGGVEVIGGSRGRRRPLPEWADAMDSTWRASTVNVYPKRRHRDEAIVEEDILVDGGRRGCPPRVLLVEESSAVEGDIPPALEMISRGLHAAWHPDGINVEKDFDTDPFARNVHHFLGIGAKDNDLRMAAQYVTRILQYPAHVHGNVYQVNLL